VAKGLVGILLEQHLWSTLRISQFKGCNSVVLFITEIKTKSAQTQLRSIYYTEQHVSTILGDLQVT
jgi:hypothetical protein